MNTLSCLRDMICIWKVHICNMRLEPLMMCTNQYSVGVTYETLYFTYSSSQSRTGSLSVGVARQCTQRGPSVHAAWPVSARSDTRYYYETFTFVHTKTDPECKLTLDNVGRIII